MANGNDLNLGTIVDDSLNDNELLSDNFSDNDNSINDSGNTEVETEVEIEDNNVASVVGNEDSGNSNSYNDLLSNNELDDHSDNRDQSDNSDNSDNSIDLDVDLDARDQSDNSTNDSYNDKDSYNDEDSYNDYEDSYNQDSYNDTEIEIDNSTNLEDESVTVGVRQYNTGFGDFHVGGMAGAGAAAAGAAAMHIEIDNRATQVDQSVNQAISADGPVTQGFANGAVVNTGDWGAAAGDDAEVNNTETTISVGDVMIGNTTIDTHIADSFNDQSSNTWTEYEMEIEDSFNSFEQETEIEVEVEDSFNEFDSDVDNDWEWENNGNIFSPGGDVVEFDL
ncbi:hypothetical protein [Microbacterium xanthum]|uniref:hypothetical protein n=1 Tax=Microbacterium xanthum TaxID=3079794 RepID=UPI002AD3D98C|nr:MULTISPECIES: hypothetical protein [unclassified Microbacterium]MDZ8170861.1 hypothetical protein [Microbacterium sp. KSW-48]MDZ8201373.1 hypothetical protein [Microbacterium sp. SSW1-59]